MAPQVFPAHRIVFYLNSLDLPQPAIQKLVEMKLAIICDVEDQLKQFEALVKEDFQKQQDPNLLKFSAPKLVEGIKFDTTFYRAFTVTPEEIQTLRPIFDLRPDHQLQKANSLNQEVFVRFKANQNLDIKNRGLQGAQAGKPSGRMVVPPQDEVPTDFRFPGME